MLNLDDIPVTSRLGVNDEVILTATAEFSAAGAVPTNFPIARRTIVEDKVKIEVFRHFYGKLGKHIAELLTEHEDGQRTNDELLTELHRLVDVLSGVEPLYHSIAEFEPEL